MNLKEYQIINETVIEIMTVLKKFDLFENKLKVASQILINVIFQARMGNIIDPSQTDAVFDIIEEAFDHISNRSNEILMSSDEETLLIIENSKKISPEFADVLDEAISDFKKIKEKHNNYPL